MKNISKNNSVSKSSLRLRIGVVMILLWLLPFWWLSPFIASIISPDNEDSSTFVVTVIIMTVQTIIGLAGVYLAGKETAQIIKKAPKKRILKTVWQIFLHGNPSS
ncbi:MAG: hypothetical protein WC828_05840 [Thermoleophilia bacterium]